MGTDTAAIFGHGGAAPAPLVVFRPGHLEEPQSQEEVCWRYHSSIRLRSQYLLVLERI
jgi:hypothetical protein